MSVAGGILAQDPIWLLGPVFLLILTAFPALFAGAAVFRALSAQRMQRLVPHSRVRMLGAVALLVASLLLLFAVFVFGSAAASGRPPPLEPFAVAFALLTALFLLSFLQFGDWRWTYGWFAIIVTLGTLQPGSPSREAFAAVPTWAWLGGALAAWAAFAAWYLRARLVRPPVVIPRAPSSPWSRTLDAALERATAVRALVAIEVPHARSGYVPGAILVAILIVGAVYLANRGQGSFTTFVWPFAAMLILGTKAAAAVQRSRLLWLVTPGSRDAVRREIERVLWRNATTGLWVLLAIAAIYASPIGGASPRDVLAGFVLAAGAGIYGQSVSLANTHSRVLYMFGFGGIAALQLALLARPAPSSTAVAIVIAAEVVGIATFRALAVRRWRVIDWCRLRQVGPPGTRPF